MSSIGSIGTGAAKSAPQSLVM